MSRVSFNSIFKEFEDGSLEPTQSIMVGGISFGPGVRFNSGVSFSGIDFTQFKGRDLEIESQNGTTIIKGIY